VFNFSRNFGRLSWSYPDLSKAADSKKPLVIHSDGLICMAKKNTLWYSWMLKIKKLFLFFFFPFLSIFSPSFILLPARNKQILLEKQTLRLKLPYGHLGQQPLKPLGSEVTHPPWPTSVHITNHHYHLHITLLTQPPVHYKTNTTTYYIYHTHTTTPLYTQVT